ncbi:MAG: TlyA family rRNA (cytidine-2'-O)-methyltransferase, partial [Clostridiales bacterium]|nr:TlyA family rRNA (cytidine-2'-O)-methyltransferase [Clostridiales bacterium]
MSARPLGVWLVENGYCADEKEAAALVMAGEALLNDRPAKAGDRVGAKDKVRLRRPPLPYAAKGGLKLEGALARFGVSVQGRVCLDA